MTTLHGSLHIQKPGAPAFLHCSLGYFAVQDERLAETPVGKHRGYFEIKKIHPHAVVAKDGTIAVQVAAVLKDFSLQTISSCLSQESSQQQQLSLLQETLAKEKASETEVAIDEVAAAPNEVTASAVVIADTGNTEKQAILSTNAIEVATSTVEKTTTEFNVVAVAAPVICTEPGAVTLPVTYSPQDILGTSAELLAPEFMLDISSREDLIPCKIRLESLGYEFVSKRQVWSKLVLG